MAQMQLPILKGDKASNDVDWRDNLPVNMFGVMRKIQGAEGYLRSFYGMKEFADGSGNDRGAVWNERLKKHYRVSGNRLLVVSSNGTVSDQGYIFGQLQCTLEDFYSFNTQGIIAQGRFYLHDGVNLTEILDQDLGNPIDGVWIDGYYFMTDGEFLFHTNINDETKIDPLKFATAEFSPDPTLGVGRTQDNKAIAFGRYSIEYFQNIASEDFAFTRLSNRALETGIVGTHCKCHMAGGWFFMGGRKEENIGVHALGTGGTQKVSTDEIDNLINNYTENQLINARLESFKQDDNHFLIVRLPDETLLYNYSYAQKAGNEGAWSILRQDPQLNNKLPIANGVFDPRLTQWVYGESNSDRIGLLSENLGTYFGEAMEYVCFSPFAPLEAVCIDEIEIDTIPGYTVEDTTLFVSTSYDAVTFGQEHTAVYGSNNSYNQRYRLRALGYVRKSIAFKFRSVTKSRLALSRFRLRYG